MAQMVKNPPAMWKTWIQLLGLEDPLEKGTATHNSILAWRIPWTEETGRLQSMGVAKSRTRVSNFHTFTFFTTNTTWEAHSAHTQPRKYNRTWIELIG